MTVYSEHSVARRTNANYLYDEFCLSSMFAFDEDTFRSQRMLVHVTKCEVGLTGPQRNWAPIGAVPLNPERDSIIKTHLAGNDIQQLAA
jgi:hypothetical protein